jgi:hypothetical protein
MINGLDELMENNDKKNKMLKWLLSLHGYVDLGALYMQPQDDMHDDNDYFLVAFNEDQSYSSFSYINSSSKTLHWVTINEVIKFNAVQNNDVHPSIEFDGSTRYKMPIISYDDYWKVFDFIAYRKDVRCNGVLLMPDEFSFKVEYDLRNGENNE